MSTFRTAWESFSADQRRQLVQALVELAEASFQVNFDAIFELCLQDPDDEVRVLAIEGLWENEQISLIGPLLAMLRADPSVQVRAAAASSLGRYVLAAELERIEPPIQARLTTELLTTIHLAGESVDVRRRALESVAYASTPEVLQPLEIAYYDEDERMRISAIIGMGRTCDKCWSAILLQELTSTSVAMRYEAALACGELMLREAVPALIPLLDDADRQVQDAAIWAMGQIGGSQAKQALLEAYQEADDNTRAALDEALAEQALFEGDLDFVLYEMEQDGVDDLIGDDTHTLWDAKDQDNWDV
jgi:HEAT repeat protein